MRKRSTSRFMNRTNRILLLLASCLILCLVLTGCSLNDIIDPVMDYFHRDAQAQEGTAPVFSEDTLVAMSVKDAQGQPLTNENGESVTVMAAYETASGGEVRRDSSGETMTYPPGEVMTYPDNAPVILPDGNYETYAGGEIARDPLGFRVKDENGNTMTRAAGEVVTRGEDAIMYDTDGEPLRSAGEPVTYQNGEFMYDENGEPVTYPVMTIKDPSGEPVTLENGSPAFRNIELVTDADGNPKQEKNGEAATRQMEPEPPQKIIEPAVEEGSYYIKSKSGAYQFFSAPSVRAGDIAPAAEDGEDPEAYAPEDPEEMIDNLQLQMPGSGEVTFEIRYDPEGYAIIYLEGTGKVLTVAESLRGGANVVLKDMVNVQYPQYKYWDDPLSTAAENQRWVITADGEGTFRICSAMDRNYVLTVNDQWGIQNANIILWKYDGREQQLFEIDTDKVVIEPYIAEGNYVIRSYLTDWMLISLGNGNYADGTTTYLDPSDQGDGQQFYITYDEYGYAVIYHADSSKALSVSNGNPADNQTVCQYEYDGGDWQKWIIEPDKNGGYNIRSKINSYQVIDLNDGHTVTGEEVHIYHDNSTLAQCWEFETDPIPSPYTFDYMDDLAQNFSSETEYLILISSGSNHVGVYQGSRGNWTNLYYWDCVTGKESTPTVKGEFVINVKSDSFDGNMDSPAWYTVYYCSSFFPDYFFHSIIYNYHTWNVMDASMGFNASHGCVRLATENAQWIHENVPLDTKVVSY